MIVTVSAKQDFHGTLRWFLPVIKVLYRIGGVELPPEDRTDISMPEKSRKTRD